MLLIYGLIILYVARCHGIYIHFIYKNYNINKKCHLKPRLQGVIIINQIPYIFYRIYSCNQIRY